MRWQRRLMVAAIPLLMIVGMVILQQSAKESSPKQVAAPYGPLDHSSSAPARKREPILARQLDVGGVSRPDFQDPDDVEVAPTDRVIGLIVAGQPRAYLRRALSGVAKKHVVRDSTLDGHITVTYCDLADCTRVFVAPVDEAPQEIRVGGLTEEGTLELLFDGRRYPQRDGKLPLAEFPFRETSWREWLALHPESKIYVGGQTDG